MSRARGKRKPDTTEGRTVPLPLWKCSFCGRRFRGDRRLEPHMMRSGHGVAVELKRSRS